jgi:preprotein translocase subunit SecG
MGTTVFNMVLLIHVVAGLVMIGLILMQHGKGADMGAAFGGGASGSLFGSSGSANFLSRTTAVLATVFFITSLSLAYLVSNAPRESSSIMKDASTPAETVPGATPVPAIPEAVPSGEGGASEIPE